MPAPSYTYTLTNGTTADATQVMQNFSDILNGVSDGTKDLSISALTCAGTATLNGNVNIGNASADDLTITGSLASSIPIKTTNSYDIGSSTLGLRALYFGANSQTAKIQGSSSMSATWTLTLPTTAGTANYLLATDGSGVGSWVSKTLEYVGTDPEVGGSTPFQLTTAHFRCQVINPAGAITVKLPTTSISAGEEVMIVNRSTNEVTIQSSDASAIDIINTGYIRLRALQATPTGSSHWVVVDVNETYTHSTTFTGPRTTGSISTYLLRSRNKVTWHLTASGFANSSATSSFSMTTAHPSRFRTSSELRIPSILVVDGSTAVGLCQINTNGTVTIYTGTGGSFTNGSSGGWYGTSFSWKV